MTEILFARKDDVPVITGAALTRVDDTNVTLTLGGTTATALLQAVSLTLGWTGTLAAARLNANVVQGIVNDTNITGSIAAQVLTFAWSGTLALSRLAQGTNGQIIVGQTSAAPQYKDLSGDATLSNLGALTLASTIAAAGPIGSATVVPIITYDAKGRLTTVTSATIAPAVGSISGLGTGVATALGVAVGSVGAFVTNGGALGTPSSGTLTNATGLPIAGLVASTVTAIGVGSIELGHATDTTITRTGSGAIAVEGVAVLLSGGALGTPSSGTLTNASGLPVSGISGLGSNVATFLATPSSANLASALTDETGSGTVVFSSAVRELLSANRTYYVRSDGSNSNTGLADTAGAAWLTLQYALNFVAEKIDFAGFTVTIQFGAETGKTWTAGGAIKPWTGGGLLNITGNGVANTIISTSGNCISSSTGTLPGKVTLASMKLTSSSGSCIYNGMVGTIKIGASLELGAASGLAHLSAVWLGAVIEIPTAYTVSGNAPYHCYAINGGLIYYDNNITVTVSSTPAWGNYGFYANAATVDFGATITWSGSATGPRYNALANGLVNTHGQDGGGLTWLPGNSAGTTSTQGQYIV